MDVIKCLPGNSQLHFLEFLVSGVFLVYQAYLFQILTRIWEGNIPELSKILPRFYCFVDQESGQEEFLGWKIFDRAARAEHMWMG